MNFIKTFKQLSKTDVGIAGGKGASLGEMTQAGIPVPSGFVILSDAFEKFLEETDLNVEIDSVLHSVDHREMHTVEAASEKIQALILAADFPKDIAKEIQRFFKDLDAKFVAVRSSATAEDSSSAAWAGQLESYLNTTKEKLLENVKKCWASLFTPRAIFYRFEKELHKQKISVAVVVQKMVASEVSGIAFSVHPVTQDRNQLIIEAGFGLGEAIVSGQITPDSYVVEKEPRRIIDKNVQTQERGLYRLKNGGNDWRDIPTEIGQKQVLSDKEIEELSELVLRIENHYGFPCDIEWAAQKGKFYIVQSRPITTLDQNLKEISKSEVKDYVETSFGDWKLGITRNMSFWHQWMSTWSHFHHSKDFGVNAINQQLAITTDGTQTSLFFRPETVAEYSRAVLKTVDTIEGIKKLKLSYQKFASELLSSLDKLRREINIENWDGFIARYTLFCAGLFLTSTIGRAGMDKLVELLKEEGISDDGIPEVIAVITYPDEHTPLFKSRLDLIEIGAKAQDGVSYKEKVVLLKEWLKNHGFIPVNFCEDPWTMDDAEKQLDELLQKNCVNELKRFRQEHKNRVEQKNKKLTEIGNEKVTVLAQAIAEGTFLNEFRKNVFSRVSLGCRDVFRKIAKLGGSENWRDCFYLIPDEARSLLEGAKFDIKKIVEKRKVVGYYTDETGVHHFIEGEYLKKFVAFTEVAYGKSSAPDIISEKTIKGFSANKGRIEGVVRIILSAKDFHKINRGDILVTTMTSVDFVPIMEKVGAFVTNEGGITSHAAIVAREMNKPCIIGTQIATKVLKDGDRVEVDADKGTVKII